MIGHGVLFRAVAVAAFLSGLVPLGLGAKVLEAGRSVRLTVTVQGTPPFAYRWRKGGSDLVDDVRLTGSRTQTLVLRGAAAADSGDYSVVVSNAAGTTVGGPAALTVVEGSGLSAGQGRPVAIAGDFTGSQPLWQRSVDGGATWSDLRDDGRILGSNTTTLSFASVSGGEHGHLLRLVDRASPALRVYRAVRLEVAASLLSFPVGVAVAPSGEVYVADADLDQVFAFRPSSALRAVAGEAGRSGAEDGPAGLARFNDPAGLVVAADGAVLVADRGNGVLRRISAGGSVARLAGTPSLRGGGDGTAADATFSSPLALALDSAQGLLVADAMGHTVRRLGSDGIVTTFAGAHGQAGYADGDGPAARFNQPSGIAVDASGNAYVADTANHLIRRISPSGRVSTLAGVPGVAGAADGSGTDALFNRPQGLAWGRDGALYVCDSANSTLRRVTPAGLVTTVAGMPGVTGLRDGPGASAWFNEPRALAADGSGGLYVADTGNAALRHVDAAGVVATVRLLAPPRLDAGQGSVPGASPPPVAPPSATPSGSGGGSGGGAIGGLLGVFAGIASVVRAVHSGKNAARPLAH